MSETMRDKLARTIYEGMVGAEILYDVPSWEEGWGADRVDSFAIADAVLDALGLTDWEAAVMRGARRLVWEQHQGCVQWDDDPTDTATSGSEQIRAYALAHARAVLEAALTAEGGKSACKG